MGHRCCRDCGTAWDSGEQWEKDHAIGEFCPGCRLMALRLMISEIVDTLGLQFGISGDILDELMDNSRAWPKEE